MKKSLAAVALATLLAPAALSQNLDAVVDREIRGLGDFYRELHASPELSFFEEKTAAKVSGQLRASGFEVTEHVGRYEDEALKGHGIVAVMKNGVGPTVLVRADLDALPVDEKTGLPYASTVRTRNEKGDEVGVMHACGHDLHMTSLVGTARVLAASKSSWKGTLVLIGQPAEERGAGAKAMLRDGLYTRFPRPDYAIALHDDATLATGKIGYTSGYALAAVDSVDITFLGVGGHGAYPNTTKDPVVIAAEFITAVQTGISRDKSPLAPAVITVGSIHGGSKHNIIPDEVRLQLTVRSYDPAIREGLLASIRRIAKGAAIMGGVPENRMPVVTVLESESISSTYNDPSLIARLTPVWERALGKENVLSSVPVMGGEDFGLFSLAGNEIPAVIFWLGAIKPETIAASQTAGTSLPSLHSSLFAPDPEPAIRTGVRAMSSAVLELLKKK